MFCSTESKLNQYFALFMKAINKEFLFDDALEPLPQTLEIVSLCKIEPLRQNLEIVSLFLYYFVFYLTGDDSNN